MSAKLVATSSGFMLEGPLTFDSVPSLWGELQKHFNSRQSIELDLNEVTYSNSAGLALLMACIRSAHQLNMSVIFKNIPKQLQQIAKVTGVETFLGS